MKKGKPAGHITINEAAELLKVHRYTINRNIKKYKIGTKKLGREVWINRLEIVKLMNPILWKNTKPGRKKKSVPRIKLFIYAADVPIRKSRRNAIEYAYEEFKLIDEKKQLKWLDSFEKHYRKKYKYIALDTMRL